MPGKRITYVVHQFLPKYFTGTEQYVFAVAKEMQARGHDVEIFSLDPFFGEADELFHLEREEVADLSVVRVRYWMHANRDWGRLEYQHPYLGERFGSYLDERKPDSVHAFHLRHLGGNLLSQSKMRDIRTFVHLMDFWFICPAVILRKNDDSLCQGPPDAGWGCIPCRDPRLAEDIAAAGLKEELCKLSASGLSPSLPGNSAARRALGLLERPKVLREQLLLADHIFAPSRFLQARFVDNGFPEERISVQGYGVDLDFAKAVTHTETSGLQIGFIGSIAEHKGIRVLIEAMQHTGSGAQLRIYGRESDFKEFTGDLKSTCAGDERISFEGSFPREQLAQVLSSIQVLVVPSLWYENTPFVILEAQAAGIPVIATDLGGMSELIEDGVDGELFPLGDAANLGRRLQRLMDEPQRLQGYRDSRPSVRSLDESCSELEELYTQNPA
ncbi:MAG: glycosyltransferase [Planctomycetota bacterium]|jgi:glycosyltransferase involved in cell wall biosynthesis